MEGLHFQTEVEANGEIWIKDFGYLGRLKPGRAIIRAFNVPESYILFTVNGKKDIIPRGRTEDATTYEKKVTIKINDGGICHTEYPENHFRVLRTRKDGRFQIWEIALVSQGGHFYLSRQLTYQECFFWDGRNVVCPALGGWPQMVDFLSEIFQGCRLRPVECYRPKQTPNHAILGKGVGYVLWWNVAMGIGAIATQQGNARVHWSQIRGINHGLRYLKGHTLVRFESLVEPRQTSNRQTAFKLEAVGVYPS